MIKVYIKEGRHGLDGNSFYVWVLQEIFYDYNDLLNSGWLSYDEEDIMVVEE